VLDSINDLIQRFVGDHVARSAVVAIFWALVGLAVYLLIWALINYSDEFGSDLAATGYVHPKNVNTTAPLIYFITRIAFQIFSLLLLVFYINFLIGVLIPRLGVFYQTSTKLWPSTNSLENGLIGIIGEFAIIHVIVVLIRFLLLRKRIFG
jgi:hypothetical protein